MSVSPLPVSAKVQTGCVVVFFADECIKEFAVKANTQRQPSFFSVIHRVGQQQAVEANNHTSNNSTAGKVPVVAGATGAKMWTYLRSQDDMDQFELELGRLRDPARKKRQRNEDANPGEDSRDETSCSEDDSE